MTLTPVEFPRFGGWNVAEDPEEIGGSAAIDMLNVDLDTAGRLRARDGYTQTFGASDSWSQVFTWKGLQTLAFSQSGASNVVAYDSSGTSISSATIAGHYFSSVPWGSTTNSYVYIASESHPTVRRWDGAAFSAPAGMPTGRFVATSPIDNRLVCASTAAETSKVSFSNAGAAETWGANDFVHVTPGDGEVITGMVTWGNQLFVFKETKFFIFYGTSIDGSGNPIFNYRTVGGHGAAPNFGQSVAAGIEGVYFFDGLAVWLTTNGEVTKISGPIEPWLKRRTPSYSLTTAGVPTYQDVAMSYAAGRLFLCVTTDVPDVKTLVWDPKLGVWLLWSTSMRSVALDPAATTFSPNQYIFATSGNASVTSGKLCQMRPTLTTDAGAAISARYRAGFWNPGQPAAESVIREWLVDGTGTVTWKTATNDAVTLGSGASVTLGVSPAIAQGRDRRSVRGRNVSFEVSGTAPWSVSRVVANLRGQRNAGLKTT